MPYRPRLCQHNQTMRLEIDIPRRKYALLDTVGNDLFEKMLNTLFPFKQTPPLCGSQGFCFLITKDDILPHLISVADTTFVCKQEQFFRISAFTLQSLEFCPLFLQSSFRP